MSNPPNVLSTHPTPIRVFLVDDHKTTLWGLERLIGSASPQMQVVGTACNRRDMLARVVDTRPDVILLDLDLGGENAAECLPDLLRETEAQVLILTGARDARVHEDAIMRGARGVVCKEETAEVVLRAIEKVHEGEVWLDRAAIGRVLHAMATSRGQPRDPEAKKIAGLTPKEREVIAALVRHAGAKTRVIAEGLHVSEHTLRNHLTVIYSKLNIRGRVDLFIYAINHGLSKVAV